jgi:hypothetical protein
MLDRRLDTCGMKADTCGVKAGTCGMYQLSYRMYQACDPASSSTSWAWRAKAGLVGRHDGT